MTKEPTEHLTTTEARGAATPHMGRIVLGASLALVVVLFAIIFFVGS
jgi:hypothetical protein